MNSVNTNVIPLWKWDSIISIKICYSILSMEFCYSNGILLNGIMLAKFHYFHYKIPLWYQIFIMVMEFH